MTKIVVTGGLGHIGSEFIRHISLRNASHVLIIDNLSTQRYPSLFNLPSGVRYDFVQEDVLTADLEKLFKGTDLVYHMAAMTDAAGTADRGDEVHRVNFTGTERVAHACEAVGSGLVFFSTTSVYGTQGVLVDENCSEEDLKPQSPYASSKIAAERFIQEEGRRNGLRYAICRLGTIFGSSVGMRFHTAVNKFIWQACLGTPITVWRTALHQKRPYLELQDAVRALLFLAEGNRLDNRVYNVLTLNATVHQIVEAIKKQVPDLSVNLVDSAIMNQLSYEVDNARFKSLGFEFIGNLEESVGETVALLKNCRSFVFKK